MSDDGVTLPPHLAEVAHEILQFAYDQEYARQQDDLMNGSFDLVQCEKVLGEFETQTHEDVHECVQAANWTTDNEWEHDGDQTVQRTLTCEVCGRTVEEPYRAMGLWDPEEEMYVREY